MQPAGEAVPPVADASSGGGETLETESVGPGVAAPTALSAWGGLPPELEATQSLVTLNYKGPEGDGTLRLALRLERETRFSVQGTDRLGRRWFRLAVDGDRAVLLNQREDTYCAFEGEVEILGVPLGPLSFSRLPVLLSNRLPARAVFEAEQEDGRWSFRDERGRDWRARFEGGELVSWTLLQDGEPEVYWLRQGELSVLSARHRELQMKWRHSKPQPLAREVASLEIPEGFAPGDCD